MKFFATAMLVLGSGCVAQAQVNAPPPASDKGNAAADFSATSAAKASLIDSLAAADTFSQPSVRPADKLTPPALDTALAVPRDTADPAAPAPEPRFVFGGREDYRWELGLGVDWLRFRSSIFNASAVGTKTSVAYYTNNWFAIEGNVSTAFAPEILVREHIKLLVYGAGPKIALRQREWEPWVHAIVGGAHEFPQTAAGSKNAFAVEVGGGADYRWRPHLAFRLEANYVRTSFFSQSQNNFQLMGGFVFHF